MVKKLVFSSFILVLWVTTILAQQPPSAASLTNVLPPSPNASAQTRYSGLPINYATGSANVQIPLGEIRSGKIVVPISINYSGGNGVKINQIASRTGMNWALSAGGLISRTVYDQPDETSKWLTPPANLGSNTTPVYFYMDSATLKNPAYDTQSDIFSFEFNGYSGKFILKPTQRTKVIQLAPSPLRIETNFHNEFVGDWNIRITDPKGFVYLFGGTTATEKSKTAADGGGCGKTYDTAIPTAWYLIKISHYAGEYVNFTYTANNFDYLVDGSQTLIRTPQSTVITPKCTSGNCAARFDNTTCAIKLQSQGVLLSTISSNLNNVIFGYVDRTDLPNDKLLGGIQFTKRNTADTTQGVIYNNFAFNYTYSSNTTYYNPYGSGASLTTRAFLSSVTRSVTGQAPQFYDFKYLNINALASRLSFAQDYWGFFNGKNNTYLIPKSTDPELEALFPSTLANREPDAAYATFGMLSSVRYPTGGKDSLQYESNTVYETRRPAIPRTYFDQTIQGTGVSTDVVYPYPFTLYSSQNITFNFSTQYSGSGSLTGHQKGILRIKDGNGIELYNTVLNLDSSNVHMLALGAGSYTAEMHAAGQATLSRLYFNYQTLGPEVTTNYQAGGVRVLRNISIPNIGLPLQKRFVYAATASPTVSSGKLRGSPNPSYYYSNLVDGFNCPDLSVSQCLNKVAFHNPVYPLTYFSGNHIYYTDVVELQNETLDNGGTVHQYLVASTQEPPLVRGGYIPGVPLSTINMNNGLERITKHFSYSAGTYKTVQLVRRNYISDLRLYQQFDNYVVRRNWLPTATSSPPSAQMFEPFDVSRFVISSDWVYADTVVTINYDLNGANPVEKRQLTKYNSITHMQPTEILANMSDGRTQKIILKYPEEMVSAGFTVPYQAMVTKNQIVEQVVREEYIGVDFKQGLTTNYTAWAGGVIEPGSIQMRTGSVTTPVIDFHAYDTMGNLLTQSQTGGIKISYKYGYWNNLPIAECKNALTTEFFSQNFEEVGAAATTTPHTGLKYFAGDYAVNWTIPNARAYKISYWYLDGTWKYAEQSYTGALTLTAGTAIDDVNIYPKDAEIKTYTYNLLAGPSSIIDQKGQTVYYTYDAYLRLEYVKDQFGNIIKSHTYHYKP